MNRPQRRTTAFQAHATHAIDHCDVSNATSASCILDADPITSLLGTRAGGHVQFVGLRRRMSFNVIDALEAEVIDRLTMLLPTGVGGSNHWNNTAGRQIDETLAWAIVAIIDARTTSPEYCEFSKRPTSDCGCTMIIEYGGANTPRCCESSAHAEQRRGFALILADGAFHPIPSLGGRSE